MDDTNNHSPAYFAFIPGMPVTVTKNVLQSLGIANGSGLQQWMFCLMPRQSE
jgi:hypothetical protein